MIEARHPALSIARQCALIGISRSAWYGPGEGESPLNLALMKRVDAQFMETPSYGSRQMARDLRSQGYCVGRKRVRRLMARMGLRAVYQKPKSTVPQPKPREYPYLLRGLLIERPSHVWCAGITYITMWRGFVSPVAIMDWATRRVLSWRLSNTIDVKFFIEALEDALRRHGRPEIFDTDQGSQFTSPRFTQILLDAAVKVSMGGRGRWMDNVMIERLWRSLKCECVYLHAFETGSAARAGIGKWIDFHTTERPHSALGGRTPIETHPGGLDLKAAA